MSSQRKSPRKSNLLVNNLLKVTEQFMTGRSYTPMSKKEIMQRLSLPEEHKVIFQSILEMLLKQGKISQIGGKFTWKQTQSDIVTGKISMHPRGFGFVAPDRNSKMQEEVFIPKQLTGSAVHGDKVEVLVNPDSPLDKGPEGRVLTILERTRTHIAGTIKKIELDQTCLAYAPILGLSQRVIVNVADEQELKVGDRIVMEIIEWGSRQTETVCQFSHFIGHINDPSTDITAAIEEFELNADFPTIVNEEARRFGLKIPLTEIKKRKDLRDLETFTIDPLTAKDFDDALSLKKDTSGHYHLAVHIADVSYYVRSNSALDKEASIRSNSTYFPGFCLPMIPKELSDNLCSLKPNVNRLCVSVLMKLDPDGRLLNYEIVRSVIKSKKRFTYSEAKEVLDGKKKSKHEKTLHLMVELCGKFKQLRAERGSIEFAIPDVEVIVDDQGNSTGMRFIAYDITHQLVEEFMLKANEIVAMHLDQKGIPLPFRIHDIPKPDDISSFVTLAHSFGFRLSDAPSPGELQQMFDKALSTPYGQFLATSFIRTMRLAIYSLDNIGHYGLKLTHYCHFTSPIRRYVDLVIHRALFGESVEINSLEDITKKCSDQERLSSRAEESVKLLKKLRWLEQCKKKEPLKQYEAIITSVKNFGLAFEVLELLIEGFVHISEIGSDYYVFHERTQTLTGSDTGERFHLGDKIKAHLVEVDLITQTSTWSITPLKTRHKFSKQRKKSKYKKKK